MLSKSLIEHIFIAIANPLSKILIAEVMSYSLSLSPSQISSCADLLRGPCGGIEQGRFNQPLLSLKAPLDKLDYLITC